MKCYKIQLSIELWNDNEKVCDVESIDVATVKTRRRAEIIFDASDDIIRTLRHHLPVKLEID